MRLATMPRLALLATALLLPGLAAALAPPAPAAHAHDEELALPVPPPEAVCLPDQGCFDVPLLVDEHGDTMSGDLTMDGADVVLGDNRLRYAAGDLTGTDALRFSGDRVCLELAPAPQCGDITAVRAGRGLTGGADRGDAALAVDPAQVCMAFQPGPGCLTQGWLLTGNSGINPAFNFLGTTDGQPVEVRVNNQRILRLEPGTMNVVAGAPTNSVTAFATGTVSGGRSNTAGGGDSPTVGGGVANSAMGHQTTVGGGSANSVSAHFGTVGGGNTNAAAGQYAVVAGGFRNVASGEADAVLGGDRNRAAGGSSVVAGGVGNTNSAMRSVLGGGDANTVTGRWNSLLGGNANRILGPDFATIGGGQLNTIEVGGGFTGFAATIAGGRANTASGGWAFIGGGDDNDASGLNSLVGGGRENVASGERASVLGGRLNTASGFASMVLGGERNTASAGYSLAAGWGASAAHDGSFVWADHTAASTTVFPSTANHQFRVRASGGVDFFTNSAATTGASLAAGSGTWSSASDRALKMGLEPVDARDVLAKVAALPLSEWSYTAQGPGVRHLGPMAQDFRAAFGLGEDERHISGVDADGVALAAIQGLALELEERDARIAALEARLAALEAAADAP